MQPTPRLSAMNDGPLRATAAPMLDGRATFDAGSVEPLALTDYGDDVLYDEERRRLFHPSHGPLYLGHDLLLPPAGHVRADGDDRVLLTRNGAGDLRAFANVCTHALRPLVDGPEPSTANCITCPFHQWSYRPDGSLIGGRSMRFEPGERDGLGLRPFPLRSWRGVHFGGEAAHGDAFTADLERMEAAFAERDLSSWLDVDGWIVVDHEDEAYRGDWKSFLEVYGDCYHVPPYHAGLASFADCATLDWVFGEAMHLQFVKLSAESGRRSPAYAAWVAGLHAYYGAKGQTTPGMAVVWSVLYPNLMLEFYNGLRVISVILPTGPDSYVNRVHYLVPADMETLAPGLTATILEAYGETAVQDRVLNESRYDGVVTARELDLDIEPYHPNLTGPGPERGTLHFHHWWRRCMGRS